MEYNKEIAGFWIRLAAFLIDFFILLNILLIYLLSLGYDFESLVSTQMSHYSIFTFSIKLIFF